jgi:hypothetical protein
MLGLPLLEQLAQLHFPQTVIFGAMGLIIGAAVAYFLWSRRHALIALLTLSPLSRLEPAIALVILILVPLALAALGSNTVDSLSIRYMLVIWHTTAIVLGLFLAAVGRRAFPLALVFVLLWLYQLGFVNLNEIHQVWERRTNQFSPASIAQLEQQLSEAQITAGYSDYWLGYALDFITEERLTLTPYNGVDRYPPYTEAVRKQATIAVILPEHLLPETAATIADMQATLQTFTGAGPAFPEFHSDMANRRLEQRLQIGPWDVWLLSER